MNPFFLAAPEGAGPRPDPAPRPDTEDATSASYFGATLEAAEKEPATGGEQRQAPEAPTGGEPAAQEGAGQPEGTPEPAPTQGPGEPDQVQTVAPAAPRTGGTLGGLAQAGPERASGIPTAHPGVGRGAARPADLSPHPAGPAAQPAPVSTGQPLLEGGQGIPRKATTAAPAAKAGPENPALPVKGDPEGDGGGRPGSAARQEAGEASTSSGASGNGRILGSLMAARRALEQGLRSLGPVRAQAQPADPTGSGAETPELRLGAGADRATAGRDPETGGRGQEHGSREARDQGGPSHGDPLPAGRTAKPQAQQTEALNGPAGAGPLPTAGPVAAPARPEIPLQPAQPLADAAARLDQVHAQMRAHLASERPGVSLRLDPPELGRLLVTLEMHAGRLNARIDVEHAEVRRLLESDVGRLMNTLQEAGLRPASVEVRTQGEGRDALPHPDDEPDTHTDRGDPREGRDPGSEGPTEHAGHEIRGNPEPPARGRRRPPFARPSRVDLTL